VPLAPFFLSWVGGSAQHEAEGTFGPRILQPGMFVLVGSIGPNIRRTARLRPPSQSTYACATPSAVRVCQANRDSLRHRITQDHEAALGNGGGSSFRLAKCVGARHGNPGRPGPISRAGALWPRSEHGFGRVEPVSHPQVAV